MPVLDIYTDGSVNPNPGVGGWAAVISDGKKTVELTGYSYGGATNNSMELTAILRAIQYLKVPCQVTVYSDSQLAVQCLNGNYKPKKHHIVDLVKGIRIAAQSGGHQVKYVHVDGHKGIEFNERADELAGKAQNDCFAEFKRDIEAEFPDPDSPARKGLANLEQRRKGVRTTTL